MHMHRILTNFLGSTIDSISTLLNENSSECKDNIKKINDEEESEVNLKSLHPNDVLRKRDQRLKSFGEV